MICEKHYLYENREDVYLTAYVLDDSFEMLGGKSRGAVLICPGGAYLSCSDREAEPVAMAFAAMGYHAFTLHYSVYFDAAGDFIMPDGKPLEPKARCVFPNPMLDIGAAILHIGKHAEAWHVDMKKLALCGFSAGAHNCAMYSVYWNTPIVTGHLGVSGDKLRPAACILGYTLSDYVFMKENSAGDPFAEGMFRASQTAFLGAPEPSDEALCKVSPARLINSDTPPMFIWATSEDGLVPVQHSTILATALASAGIPFELHIFEKGGHGLSLASQATAGAKSDINPRAASWVELCRQWLDLRIAIDLPAKSRWEMLNEK